jgi:hypothetical protein
MGLQRKKDISNRKIYNRKSCRILPLEEVLITERSQHIVRSFNQLRIKHQLNCVGHLFVRQC